MELGPVNRELFGETPRYVGLVGSEREGERNQFLAFDEVTLNLFLSMNYGDNNMYTRISYLGNAGGSILDKVFLDLDIEKPDGVDDYASEIIPVMRDDRLVADDVLGDVVEDARAVASFLEAQDLPAIAVFSGLGVHVHVLTQAAVQPDRELRTMVRWIEAEAELETLDDKGAREGDYNRLCRIANCPRVGADGSQLDLYTIPLSMGELKEITAEELLALAREPRQVPVPHGDRPEMEVKEEYDTETGGKVLDVGTKEVGDVPHGAFEDQLEAFLKDAIRMPCMYERIMSRNPDHHVRFNVAILLFNCGLDPDGVQEIYEKLGWFDYDPEVTRKQLWHIWETGYRSSSCQSIQEKGLCVYDSDGRESCPTFGWRGGQASYNDNHTV